MKYNFSYKKPGVKSLEHILFLDTPSPIRDFCCVNNGFFIVEDYRSYLINTNREIQFERNIGYNEIRSICSYDNEVYGLTNNSGNIINMITQESWLKAVEKNKFSKYFQNIKEYNGHIQTDNVYMSVSIEDLNRVFILNAEAIYKTIGNGRRDYCLSSNILESGVSLPKGIVLYNDELFISDYGNGCIRSFSSFDYNVTHKVIAGSPTKKNIKANKMFVINKILYYDSNDVIYQCSIGGGNPTIYYKNDKLRNISINHDRTKIIMMMEM